MTLLICYDLCTEETISRSPQRINGNLSFDPEFHGRKKGKRKSKFEYQCFHGIVVNALAEQVEKDNSTFNTRLIDLGVQEEGNILRIYEVKTSLDRQSIYTGIGQLMFHSIENDRIEKVLVLPKNKLQEGLKEILEKLNIKIMTFTIVNGEEVRFVT